MPGKSVLPTQYSIAAKFFSVQHPQVQANDNATLIAIGSTEEVAIELILKDRSQRFLSYKRPKYYPSENLNKIVSIQPALPCICWGYGRTPYFKD